jgi:hypothetical protein
MTRTITWAQRIAVPPLALDVFANGRRPSASPSGCW